ncbi:MAG TPA: ABC transporter substrate-binding protein [Candidatus Binatus sp.]|nr:ABC transporter substrate-binding protein [Candidatus Binatus sp.]
MIHPRPRTSRFFLAALLIIAALPFSSGQAIAQLEKITLGYPATAMSHFPVFVGREFGQFRDEGLDVQLVRVSGNVVVAALLAGELGYTTSGDGTVRSAVLGLPIKMLAAIGVKPSLSLIVRPEIKTVADLKGKAIAISTPGTTTDFTAREIVKHYGLNPDRDITTVGLGDQPQRMAAMQTGAVAGAIVTPPNDLKAEAQGFRLLVFTGDFMEDSLLGVLGTSERRIKERPDQVKKMVRAVVKTLLFIRQQPEQVTSFAQRFWKLDRKQAEKSYELIVKTMSRDGSATDAAMQAAIYQAKVTSKIQKDILPAQLVDLSFLREAQQELKLR